MVLRFLILKKSFTYPTSPSLAITPIFIPTFPDIEELKPETGNSIPAAELLELT